MNRRTRPKHRANPNFVDLPRRRTWQLGPLLDGCGRFPVAQPLPAMGENRVVSDGPARTERDHRLHRLAAEAIRRGHHRTIVNGFELADDAFDLRGADLEAADVDDVLDPAGDIEKAVAVDVADIAGAMPAGALCGRRQGGIQ